MVVLFSQWLARMTRNQTATGELARYLTARPDWAGVASDRLAILAYLDAQDASREQKATFSRAWASYTLALKQAQDAKTRASGQAITVEPVAGETRASGQETGQICEQCGAPGRLVPGLQKILCRMCMRAMIDQLHNALGDPGQ